MKKLLDRFLLIGAALLLCVTTGVSFLLGEIYHLNPAWLFFAWNSIFLLPILWKKFRGYFGRRGFVVFFITWMCFHGATVIAMMIWVPIELWLFVLVSELAAGFLVAHWLFAFPLNQETSVE
jgi:hypothetical protein